MMVLVRKGNVELEVNEDFLNQYLSNGFDCIDDKGNLVQKGTANNFNSLQLQYAELQAEHIQLKKQIDVLETELKKAQKKK